MSPASIQRVIVAFWVVGMVSYIILALNSSFGIYENALGGLPIESLIVLLLFLVASPLFERAKAKAGRFSYLESRLYYDLTLGYIFILLMLLSIIIKVYL